MRYEFTELRKKVNPKDLAICLIYSYVSKLFLQLSSYLIYSKVSKSVINSNLILLTVSIRKLKGQGADMGKNQRKC